MTTKEEEVLRIVKDAGFDMAIFNIKRDLMTVRLIELAKQAGFEEAREAVKELFTYLIELNENNYTHDDVSDANRGLIAFVTAIHNL